MPLVPEDWGFATGEHGELRVGGLAVETIAREYGTPLHVVDEPGLQARATRIVRAFADAYPGSSEVHYALKCNNTPGVVAMILDSGLLPEVGTAFEWTLARRLGASPDQILVNGPHKGPLLKLALDEGAGLIVLDGPADLELVERAAWTRGVKPRVLLRVNPDCVPRGMNKATATGSRRGSVFGFDLRDGELGWTLMHVATGTSLRFAGFHCHAGTGIRRAEDYVRPVEILVDCAAQARRFGLRTDVLDVGGGFGVPTSRELDTWEFLLYQATGHLPAPPSPRSFPSPEDFARVIASTTTRACARAGLPLPQLVIEPGRAIASGAGLLLLTVGSLKQRDGAGTWAVTDGGAGTVAFPVFYEYHEVLLCRAPAAPRTHRYTIVGPACFSADWVYRHKAMPELRAGDVLAICDAGAYFTAQESNFGFPRPAIVAVRDGVARLLRRRETFDDMIARDVALPRGERHALRR